MSYSVLELVTKPQSRQERLALLLVERQQSTPRSVGSHAIPSTMQTNHGNGNIYFIQISWVKDQAHTGGYYSGIDLRIR